MDKPQLYVKVMKGKKTTYQEYNPYVPCPELEKVEAISLVSVLATALIMNVQKHLPEHSKLARHIKKVEVAVVDLAKLYSEPLNENLLQVGARAWEAAINEIQSCLEEVRSEQVPSEVGTIEGSEEADTKSPELY